MNVVSSILASCHGFTESCGSEPVSEAVQSLDSLNEITQEQIAQTIGLIDGNLELNKRYANLARAERQAVADEAGFDSSEDVCSNKARGFNGGNFSNSLTNIRARLVAVHDLLGQQSSVVSPKAMIPVPAADGSSDTTDRGAFRRS